jgi:hypothetical protein
MAEVRRMTAADVVAGEHGDFVRRGGRWPESHAGFRDWMTRNESP